MSLSWFSLVDSPSVSGGFFFGKEAEGGRWKVDKLRRRKVEGIRQRNAANGYEKTVNIFNNERL